MKSKYDEYDALNTVIAAGCKVIENRIIKLPAMGPGIKAWGAIDYLRKHRFYCAVRPK